jgi:hypothetical protein
LLVPVAYVEFDRLEQTATSQRAKAWLGRLRASTVGRLRPAQ